MNRLSHITLVGWETRNWRHRERALVWCKDYGFRPITRHVFIGELYPKERSEMGKKFKALFTGKSEKFFFATICKSCFNDVMTDAPIRDRISRVDHFELVQMPKEA
jgi:hypothetical protein